MRRELSTFLKYSIKRAVTLFIVVTLAIYATIIIANMGGYVDEIVKAETRENINLSVYQNPAYQHLSPEEKKQMVDALYQQEIERLGLDQPFIYRSIRYLTSALTLNLGRAHYLTSDSGSRTVRNIILERLPTTILLFTTINLMLFFLSLLGGLFLSRKYGSKLDKAIVALSPLSSIPGWFYGIFLILIFASWLRWLPYGGLVDVPPPTNSFDYALSVLKHMILPVASWLVAYSFIQIYVKRTFFLMFSSEDYVEMAKAKGLSPRLIERRYILKPTLPPIITEFALMLIGSWMGAIVTERVFNWPGIGSLFYQAVGFMDSPVIIGEVAIYAYLLAITVFILDIIYAIVDPRIRIGGAAT
ncbi:MAG: ABC transporter permease [Candidatus Bathyarchaeota archaeon]|jgi:peptide/nickel transport system permease protein|nr:ABC transporter permease [Candidatus Bathyarchaeota archaeon]